MRLARQITGGLALVSYLVMGLLLYRVVIPGAGGAYPPDFHPFGYDVAAITPFVTDMTEAARDTYAQVLTRYDRVFMVALAVWLACLGWRGGAGRYVVAGLAAGYALADMAEDATIYRFVYIEVLDPGTVAAASTLTMAKFALLGACVVALVWHLRRQGR